jgi:hypothetical protein
MPGKGTTTLDQALPKPGRRGSKGGASPGRRPRRALTFAVLQDDTPVLSAVGATGHASGRGRGMRTILWEAALGVALILGGGCSSSNDTAASGTSATGGGGAGGSTSDTGGSTAGADSSPGNGGSTVGSGGSTVVADSAAGGGDSAFGASGGSMAGADSSFGGTGGSPSLDSGLVSDGPVSSPKDGDLECGADAGGGQCTGKADCSFGMVHQLCATSPLCSWDISMCYNTGDVCASVTSPAVCAAQLGCQWTPGPNGCCPAGLTRCGAVCADLKRDVNHCGTCETVCPNPNHAKGACSGGACTFECVGSGLVQFAGAPPIPSGTFGDCDGDPGNGCETDLCVAPLCGACGSPCTIGTCTCIQNPAGDCGAVRR